MSEDSPFPIPSRPVPETPAHRLALSRRIASETGLNDAILERVVRAFYGTARRDREIGFLFDGVADWEAHFARITEFWSSVVLLTGRYHGQPLVPHLKLPLEPRHFARWLVLFEQTAREICPPMGAALLIEKAHRIARSLRLGVEVHRGELPERRAVG